jgi:protein SCO1/2
LLQPSAGHAAEPILAPLYQTGITWTDDSGKPVSLNKWQGKPVVISMAYSTCRKFCPITVNKLAAIQLLFDEKKIDAEFVVISYDPASDKWQDWAQYRKVHKLYRDNWHFLTGSLQDTKTISQMLGMDYWLYDEHVMHNFKIDLLNARGDIIKSIDWDSQDQIETLIPEPDTSKP